jgi:hypothetical protein
MYFCFNNERPNFKKINKDPIEIGKKAAGARRHKHKNRVLEILNDQAACNEI